MQAGVNLNVLGGFGLQVNGQKGPDLPRKTRALLAVLAVDNAKPLNRETAAELIWPGRGPEQSRNSLKEALFGLRKPLRAHDVVISQDGGLVLGAGVATDIAAFRHLADASELATLQRAADAYAGPLMAGFRTPEDDFNDWLALSRATLEKKVLAVLARIAGLCTANGDFAGAMAAAERMFAIDRLDEEIHRRLINTCAAAGRRAEALRYYSDIVDLLRRELGVSPGRETRELAQQLRREIDPQPLVYPASGSVPAQPGTVAPPIAVMPLRQIGSEPVPDHIADGLVTDIVCQLAGLRDVSVISHGSTLSMRDPALDTRAVGRALGVRYVVHGAIRRVGPLLRLTVDLADASSGMVVWSRTHDADVMLGFSDQDRIVAQVVHTLAPRVQEIELQRIRGRRPASLSAYELVLLARHNLQSLQPENFAATQDLLTRAVATDPGYAEAYALMAEWHGLRIAQNISGSIADDEAEADRLSQRALSLDSNNLRALIRYGHRRSLLHRDYSAALALFDRALDSAPNAAHAWLWSSLTFSYLGDAEEALTRAERALRLSPRDPEAHFGACQRL